MVDNLRQKQNKAEQGFIKRHPEVGKLVKNVLKTREVRTGKKSAVGAESGEFSDLTSNSLPPVGGARIISDS